MVVFILVLLIWHIRQILFSTYISFLDLFPFFFFFFFICFNSFLAYYLRRILFSNGSSDMFRSFSNMYYLGELSFYVGRYLHYIFQKWNDNRRSIILYYYHNFSGQALFMQCRCAINEKNKRLYVVLSKRWVFFFVFS